MKILNCPICGSFPVYEKKPLWEGSRGYHGRYSYALSCPKCKLVPKVSATDISESEDEARKNIMKDWNQTVKMIEKYLKHRDKVCKNRNDNEERVF